MNSYNRSEVCPFSKAKEEWGCFGNMTGGHPFRINRNFLIYSSEALYQACKYPDYPEVQKEILEVKSGMGAKMVANHYVKTHIREDFDDVKEDIMEWCLRLKLANSKIFRDELLRTGNRDIVEVSHKDKFWGTVPRKDNPEILEGQNILGKLLMKLREKLKSNENPNWYKKVSVPLIPNFRVLNSIIVDIQY